MSQLITLGAQIHPEHVAKYVEMHRAVPAHVQDALLGAGHRDYRLFVHGSSAFAQFQFVGDDLDATRRAMRARPNLADWIAQTSACQRNAPDGIWAELKPIFALN